MEDIPSSWNGLFSGGTKTTPVSGNFGFARRCLIRVGWYRLVLKPIQGAATLALASATLAHQPLAWNANRHAAVLSARNFGNGQHAGEQRWFVSPWSLGKKTYLEENVAPLKLTYPTLGKREIIFTSALQNG